MYLVEKESSKSRKVMVVYKHKTTNVDTMSCSMENSRWETFFADSPWTE